ncbi:MAG: hypothetical protein DRI46_09620 [Chloroflexi bacterium]|nr:MAG: hypothetical protein DRI46_09620 [Chloroflexota bacterium]
MKNMTITIEWLPNPPLTYTIIRSTLHGSDGLLIGGSVIVADESGNEFYVAGDVTGDSMWHNKDHLATTMHNRFRKILIDEGCIVENNATIMTFTINGKVMLTHNAP